RARLRGGSALVATPFPLPPGRALCLADGRGGRRLKRPIRKASIEYREVHWRHDPRALGQMGGRVAGPATQSHYAAATVCSVSVLSLPRVRSPAGSQPPPDSRSSAAFAIGCFFRPVMRSAASLETPSCTA